jgi:hypothetical protein
VNQRVDRRGLVWQLAGSYLTATCYGSPSDAVFDAMLQWVRGSGVKLAGVIMEDRRGWFGSMRLGRFFRIGRELGVPVVMLSNSPLVGAAALVSRWLGSDIRVGSRRSVGQALQRLAVPEAQQATVKAAVHALRVARALGSGRRRRRSDASSQTPVPVG